MATIGIIGAGVGSLTAAGLLAKAGHKVQVIEQNYLPGGCASSYFRQGYVFESGATTLVGLDEGLPLRFLLDELNIRLDTVALNPSMRVHWSDGASIDRFQNLEAWIGACEALFGKANQRAFWEYCYDISRFVWSASLNQLSFPPTRLKDIFPLLKNFRFQQLQYARLGFQSMRGLLERYNLHTNPRFVSFVNEQLLITAQNPCEEVNVLFGATALCYTNIGNYYLFGGMIQLINPIVESIRSNGGEVLLKTCVEKIQKSDNKYLVQTNKGEYSFDKLVSGVPINNTLDLYPNAQLSKKLAKRVLPSERLYSAFQIGIGFRRSDLQKNLPLHHQIHTEVPLPVIGSASFFVSFSHPDDWMRAPAGEGVISISTHIKNPQQLQTFDTEELTNTIFELLEKHGLLRRADILYHHTATPKTWADWTLRKWGSVGGYPQYLKTKPWQLLDARLDGKGLYQCGDTVYPGQGIVGVCLGGISVVEKMRIDGLG